MQPVLDLSGEVAVVTGGAGGIGAATCQMLCDAGAQVAVADLDATGAAVVARECGPAALPVAIDVTKVSSIASGLSEIVGQLGRPSILVNNAFTNTVGEFLQVSSEDNRLTLQVILEGTMYMSRAVLEGMLTEGRGSIVSIVSDAGLIGEPNMVAYSAAKAGVVGFTRALAKELGPRGIRVNGVSPGGTRTVGSIQAMALQEIDEVKLARRYPLRRLGEPEDIAGTVVWLVSPLASWITGQIISVNGGYA